MKKPIANLFEQLKLNTEEQRRAAMIAAHDMIQLCHVMRQKTDQGYHLRGLLFSLWNGKPVSLQNVVCLDWQVRKTLIGVITGFGCETQTAKFFYNQMRHTIEEAGLWDWFLEEAKKPAEQPYPAP